MKKIQKLSKNKNWNKFIGDIWFEVITNINLSKKSIIVELAPGKENKIGLGLSKYGFKGEIYLVEPNKRALTYIARQYRKELPSAKIFTLPLKLKDAIPLLPKKVDAIVSNHPLDDLLVGKFLGSNFGEYFDKIYNTPDMKTRYFWKEILRRPKKIKSAKKQIINEFLKLIKRTSPSFVAISQYKSYLFQTNMMKEPDEQAFGILKKLRALFISKERKDIIYSIKDIKEKERWLILDHPISELD